MGMPVSGKLTAKPLPHIPALKAYTPGIQPTDKGWIKLNTNELPYPPSPKVAEAILNELAGTGESLRLYPNPTSAPLRQTIAKLHGLTEQQVCIGNGSDDILNLIIRCSAGGTSETGMTFPSYSLYPVLVGIQNGVTVSIPFDRSMRLPVEKIVASKASVFFLTSPNAPTGVAFSNTDIETILKGYQGLLVVDEAYAPFASHDAVSLLAHYPNLVIVRTFSKAYALAGIRVGYCLANPEVIGWLDRVRDSYNVNRLSQAAAMGALLDPLYYNTVVNKVKATRDTQYKLWTEKRGWFTYRSEANFLFTEPKNAQLQTGPEVAKQVYDFLVSHKILVRLFASHALTASFIRISIGTDAEMAALNETLDAWLKAKSALNA
jgi:histidinol-phosphate aminotransferase